MRRVGLLALVLLLIVIVVMMVVPVNHEKKIPYFYVEFKDTLVFHDMSIYITATVSPPGYLMGIAPHSLVFSVPEKQGKMRLLRLYGISASKTIGIYDIPTLLGFQGDTFSTVIYGKTLSDMRVCAISVKGDSTCVPLPSDIASDIQTLPPQLVNIWYDGKYFYYLGRFIARFDKNVYKQLDDNGDFSYAYVLPLPAHKFILGGKRLSLYGEDGYIKSATISLMPRWISSRMVLCSNTVVVPAGSSAYVIQIPTMRVLKKIKGIPVGCLGGRILLFRGTYPIKGDIVSEDGKVYLQDVSFGALIGGYRP